MAAHQKPFRMAPCYKHMPWGGTRLNELFNKHSDNAFTGESWEAACHKNGSSIVADGEHMGSTLGDLARLYGRDFLGSRASGDAFPVLFKLIDARDRLSVQVHPDDTLAAADGDNGKNEMWIVLSAEPGSGLYLGFRQPVTPDEFRRRIKDGSLEEILQFLPARTGDAFFIPAGLVHAIGGGLVIAEIQQSSDATYRVYDWGRLGLDGLPRPLHIEKALLAVKPALAGKRAAPLSVESGGIRREWLPGCRLFAAQYVKFSSGCSEHCGGESFQILFFSEGSGVVASGGRSEFFCKGDTFVFAATSGDISVEGSGSYYRFFIPDFANDYRRPLTAAGFSDESADALFTLI